jgi:hypothetical protein
LIPPFGASPLVAAPRTTPPAFPDFTRMTDARQESIQKFLKYAKSLDGDEKGESHVFLDRLFQAFGHEGYKEAGATLEDRLRISGRKGTRFMDLTWGDRLLLEMKKRGSNLAQHYNQIRDYWHDNYPKARYVVLCNFDEFWIHDFFHQADPVDVVPIDELSTRYLALAFLLPGKVEPHFNNDRVAVSREAANAVAKVFNQLVARGEKRDRAQRFILQCVFCLFAEDFGLLPRGLFTQLIKDAVADSEANTYDLFGALFQQMNSEKRARGGRFKNVDYFNGGLFAEIDPIELNSDELALMAEAAEADWSKVQPAVFGALFEGSMDKRERHAFGAHFTSEADIMKVVRPTIERPWLERIEKAKTLKELNALRAELLEFRVLDPACGCGNFLYVAYREMRRLEMAILTRIHTEFGKKARAEAGTRPLLSLKQFFGIDINPFAVELAKVTLMLGREQGIEATREMLASGQLDLPLEQEPPLPLDNLDENIIEADALFIDWPKADAIIGNPPFLGAKRIGPERGGDYTAMLREQYPDIPGMADYCVYWIRRSHDHLPPWKVSCPTSGRAGLVGTQNVRNNKSREGGLDYLLATGQLIEAVDSMEWSGEASVDVSIFNWAKTTDPTIDSGSRTLWVNRRAAAGSGGGAEPLIATFPTRISASLSGKTDVTGAKTLTSVARASFVANGQFPRTQGFIIAPREAHRMLRTDVRNASVVHPFMIGRTLLTKSAPDRWCIDFQNRDVLEANAFAGPFEHLEKCVLPHIENLAKKERSKTGKDTGQDQGWLTAWWRFFRARPELVRRLEELPRYFACCEVTKRPIFEFVHPSIRPDHTLEVFVTADDYSFGILQSSIHGAWFLEKCSRLSSRFRYTPQSVFDTFPWPQGVTLKQAKAVAKAAVDLRALRRDVMEKNGWSLRDLYRTLDTPGANPLRDAHDALDEAVRAAYGMKKNDDILAFLLALNHEVAAREERGEPVVGPGLPPCVKDPAPFITDDCIRAELPAVN